MGVFPAILSAKICASSLEYNHDAVARSIGKVILMQDRVIRFDETVYNFGGVNISQLIDEVYKQEISKLPVAQRAVFFGLFSRTSILMPPSWKGYMFWRRKIAETR